MAYKVIEELTLPPEIHGHRIEPHILEFFDGRLAPQQKLLAQLAISGARYDDAWRVSVWPFAKGPDELLGAIWCDKGTARDDVLATADSWIRESEASLWVPDLLPLDIPLHDTDAPDYVEGKTLVQGREIPKSLSAQSQKPEQQTRSTLGQIAGKFWRRS